MESSFESSVIEGVYIVVESLPGRLSASVLFEICLGTPSESHPLANVYAVKPNICWLCPHSGVTRTIIKQSEART